MNKNWWNKNHGFFGQFYEQGDDSLEGSYYDKKLNRNQRTKEEIGGVINLCKLKKENKILDCPCGWGRHAISLSKKGFNVTGIDLNDYELRIAKNNSKKNNVNAKFVKKDMRKINYLNEFDCIINMWYSFGFFENDEDNIKSLKNFYNALKKRRKVFNAYS